jgi:hypothetical protein
MKSDGHTTAIFTTHGGVNVKCSSKTTPRKHKPYSPRSVHASQIEPIDPPPPPSFLLPSSQDFYNAHLDLPDRKWGRPTSAWISFCRGPPSPPHHLPRRSLSHPGGRKVGRKERKSEGYTDDEEGWIDGRIDDTSNIINCTSLRTNGDALVRVPSRSA